MFIFPLEHQCRQAPAATAGQLHQSNPQDVIARESKVQLIARAWSAKKHPFA
jgi:hypothetical protein